MRTYTQIEIEPFEPAWIARNPHTQTLLGNFSRKRGDIHFRRTRLDTPDGDFLDIDFADVPNATWGQLGEDKPVLLLIHGLEGNARSGPAHEIYRYLSLRGIRCVGMNLRSCSGEMNRTAQLYHAGATEDLKFVHEWLLSLYPDVPLGLVGISLGANILLKYLGENGATLTDKAHAAVAVSPPFDLLAGAAVMERGLGRMYTENLLRPLRSKAVQIAPRLEGIVDMEQVRRARTLRQFDDVFTAPLHGFDGAEDYYAKCSSQNFLADIQVPTLMLRAIDDPFFDPADIPYKQVEQNECLYAGFPQHGGHVGFVEGTPPGPYTYWAERQAARFLALVI